MRCGPDPRLAQRAAVILELSKGSQRTEAAELNGSSAASVRKWKRAFQQSGIASFRSGTPSSRHLGPH
jgi:transposase